MQQNRLQVAPITPQVAPQVDINHNIKPDFKNLPISAPKTAFFLCSTAYRLLYSVQRNFCGGMSVLGNRIYIITKWSVLYEIF